MTLTQLKNQFKRKLERSKDPEILRAALQVLELEGSRIVITGIEERVARSEKDYLEGRTMTITEAKRRSKGAIRELYSSKKQRKQRA